MSPRRLFNIKIDEVSSVSKGSSPGATVRLLKSANERNQTMSESDLGFVSVAKRGARAVTDGVISQATGALLEQRLAQEQFPNAPTMGHALALWHATPHGRELQHALLEKAYRDTQLRSALGGGHDAVMKMNTPRAHAEQPDDTDDDGDGDETIDQKVERLMRDKNISRDAAISILHRAEKIAKGISV